MKQKQTRCDTLVVLKAKFRQAQAMVDVYEANVARLRSITQEAVLQQVAPTTFRAEVQEFNRRILRSSLAKSLIADDHACIVKKLGKKFQQRINQAWKCWQQCNTELASADEHPLAPDKERFLLAKFALVICEVLELGIQPIRHLRDQYLSSLKPNANRRSKKGRPKALGKPARDAAIYRKFCEMPGKKGARYETLGRDYDLKSGTVRKIVGQENRKSGK